MSLEQAMNQTDLVKVYELVSQGKYPNGYAIIKASRYGHIEIVKYFVSQGLYPYVENDMALKESVTYGHIKITKFLVSLGANIYLENEVFIKLVVHN